MKIYNTLTRKKEEFVPIEEGKVSMYVWVLPCTIISTSGTHVLLWSLIPCASIWSTEAIR